MIHLISPPISAIIPNIRCFKLSRGAHARDFHPTSLSNEISIGSKVRAPSARTHTYVHTHRRGRAHSRSAPCHPRTSTTTTPTSPRDGAIPGRLPKAARAHVEASSLEDAMLKTYIRPQRVSTSLASSSPAHAPLFSPSLSLSVCAVSGARDFELLAAPLA